MIVISSAVVLSAPDPVTLDAPVIGWKNVLTPAGIVADSALSDFPATNLANPATHQEWRAATAVEQYLTVTTNEVDPIDYVGIARHNFASAEIAVSIEGYIGGVWVEIVEEVMLPDDGPALFRFSPQSLSQIRIRMQAGLVPPRAAVVYVGKLLIMERRIYVGHTPLPHGRRASVANNRSESGNFLGRIVLGAWRESVVPLSLISPDWYRANLDTFLRSGRDDPFFFAWRPETYPRETGYAWLLDDPMPAPAGPSNLISLDLKLAGIA